MRVLGCLALFGLLLPALATRAQLSEADGLISPSFFNGSDLETYRRSVFQRLVR